MARTAKEIMQTQVLTLSPSDPLHTAQRLFYEEGIHGAPVVDDQGQVLGILTSTDILRAANESDQVDPTEPAYFRDDLDFSLFQWSRVPDDFKERLRDTTVADVMTEQVVEVAPDTPIRDVARALRENKIHRLLVIESGSLRGIITTFDLVCLLEQQD
jgi:CBS domain-containing protein